MFVWVTSRHITIAWSVSPLFAIELAIYEATGAVVRIRGKEALFNQEIKDCLKTLKSRRKMEGGYLLFLPAVLLSSLNL